MITIQNNIALSRNWRPASRFGAAVSASKTHSVAEVLGLAAKESLQQIRGALRLSFRKEMPAFDGLSDDIVGPLPPQRERAFRIPAVERQQRKPRATGPWSRGAQNVFEWLWRFQSKRRHFCVKKCVNAQRRTISAAASAPPS